MPSWNDLLGELESLPDAKSEWLKKRQTAALETIREIRGERNVLFYASAFLQKPEVPAPWLQISHEDVNGFMSTVYGMEWDKGLTLLIHTPGGVTNAAESVVSYLWSKFTDIEIIVPMYAMSAGTMICLASNNIVMGRQSQLGPIDPQMPMGGRFVSSRSIVDQFDRAKNEILANLEVAHVWAPVLHSIGPALLQEAQNTLDYSEQLVTSWLAERMFKDEAEPEEIAARVANHFSGEETPRSHGRRIDRQEARDEGLHVEYLEDNQRLQEEVLTAYHLMTLVFEKTPASKMIVSNTGRMWVKNWVGAK